MRPREQPWWLLSWRSAGHAGSAGHQLGVWPLAGQHAHIRTHTGTHTLTPPLHPTHPPNPKKPHPQPRLYYYPAQPARSTCTSLGNFGVGLCSAGLGEIYAITEAARAGGGGGAKLLALITSYLADGRLLLGQPAAAAPGLGHDPAAGCSAEPPAAPRG
jgi:hypothetical protein